VEEEYVNIGKVLRYMEKRKDALDPPQVSSP
jgi:hypothetical protein